MIRGTILLLAAALCAAHAETPLPERRSGYEFMGAQTRAMQDDDATGPAVLWLLEGEELWNRKAGAASKACGDCHGDARESMRGVAARYPAMDAKHGRALNLDQRINACRTDRQQATPFAWESRPLLSLSAFVARQSRGMPVEPAAGERSAQLRAAGRAEFERRQGQLNLSCAQCHEHNWGKSLAGVRIPQAHPTGSPLYRLEWQNLGSLQRRLRNCMIGIRAEPYAWGAPEMIELEYYLMWRARGMKIESPAVRP